MAEAATSFVATKVCLSRRQKYVCHDKHIFVATNMILSLQNICRYKHTFVATNIILSCQNIFCLKYACRDKHVFVATNICLDKRFVTTKIFCRDKHNFVCRDKTFVKTKMMLVAAPANDRHSPLMLFFLCSVYILPFVLFFSFNFFFLSEVSVSYPMVDDVSMT